jgi:hypothetical protein
MNARRSLPTSSPATAGPSFGLGALLLVICLLATCLGLGRMDPLLGMLVAMVAAPALGRTAEVIQRQRSAGERVTSGRKLLIFLASLGLIAAAAGTTLGVAAAVGALGILAGWGLVQLIDAPWLPVVAGVWGFVLGLPAGLSTAMLIVQRGWTA